MAEVTYLNQEQLKTHFLSTGLTKEPHAEKKSNKKSGNISQCYNSGHMGGSMGGSKKAVLVIISNVNRTHLEAVTIPIAHLLLLVFVLYSYCLWFSVLVIKVSYVIGICLAYSI